MAAEISSNRGKKESTAALSSSPPQNDDIEDPVKFPQTIHPLESFQLNVGPQGKKDCTEMIMLNDASGNYRFRTSDLAVEVQNCFLCSPSELGFKEVYDWMLTISVVNFTHLAGFFYLSIFWIGEWLIKRLQFVKHIYSASKQISSAISPDQNITTFKEVAIICHPRVGEYALGFITSSVVLQRDDGDEELCSVYVPTNHLYIGDVFLVNSTEIIRPNLTIRKA